MRRTRVKNFPTIQEGGTPSWLKSSSRCQTKAPNEVVCFVVVVLFPLPFLRLFYPGINKREGGAAPPERLLSGGDAEQKHDTKGARVWPPGWKS